MVDFDKSFRVPNYRDLIEAELPSVAKLAKEWSESGRLVPVVQDPDFKPAAPSIVVPSRCLSAIMRALREAKLQIETLPSLRSKAVKTNESLGDMARHLEALLDQKRVQVLAVTLAGSDLDAHALAFAHLEGIEGLSRALLAALNRFHADFNCRPVQKKNRQISWFVINELARVYVDLFEKPVPKGRSGPFVELAAAVWSDLGWPLPRGQTDAIGWLGMQIEKHPAVTEKGRPK